MHCRYLKRAAIIASLLACCTAAADDGERHRFPILLAQAPAPAGQASLGAEREAIPAFVFRGQLRLTAEQRRQIWQGIQQSKAEQQPVPRAFAPAVGQTAPQELRLSSLPPSLQGVSGLEKQHQFAVLNTGAVLIVREDRLVVAMIQPEDGNAPGNTSPAPPALTPGR